MYYPSVSLVIPCYNESARIIFLQDGLKDFMSKWQGDYEIILVNDGSNDGTEILLAANPFFAELMQAKKMKLIHQTNIGKGGALKSGINEASKDFILTLDADMATEPAELIKWLQIKNTFDNNEILIASRELKNSQVKDSLKRKIVGNIFNFIIRKKVGLNIQDTQCGFKLYPAAIAKLLFANLKTPGWAHDVEILKKAKDKNIQITEMPVIWNAVDGSKINVLSDGWKMFWEVMRISSF